MKFFGNAVTMPKQTNEDRIRTATNVELVNALEAMCYGMKNCAGCVLHGKCPVNKPGVKDPESLWSDWLQQPYTKGE